MEIGLTFDLRTDHSELAKSSPADWDAEFDSPETIDFLENTLRALGFRTRRIGNVRQLAHFLSEGGSVDLVFNTAEGIALRSREAQVPALLDAFGVSYTFSDPLTMALCLDKAMTKRIWQGNGLPTTDFVVVESGGIGWSMATMARLGGFPLFVKPLHEGSAKGIDERSIVTSWDECVRRCSEITGRYAQPAIVEPFLPGKEFTIGILGSGRDVEVLGVAEIVVRGLDRGVYGFLEKEDSEHRVDYRDVPPGQLRDRVVAIARAAYLSVDCRDAGRVDMRLDADGEPKLLEINPLPGLHPTHSDLPMIATLARVTYPDLIGRIVRSAIQRHGRDLKHGSAIP